MAGRKAYLLRPGERGPIWSLGGHSSTKASAADTDGGYALPPDDLVVPVPEVLGPIAARSGIDVVGPPLRVRG